jgi:hypothetical protein
VIHLEARGNTGPSQMFETTPGNGPIVRAWAQAVPSPAGASLAYEVYKRLPNDSDFTEFKRLNAVGLNFAFIGNVEAYHTPADSAEALDAGSLQAQGETAFALAKRLGDADLDLQAWRGRDAVYFSMPGGMVLRYSTLWAIPLAALAAIAWAWLLIRLRRSGRASIGGVAIALVLLAVAIAAQIWLGLKASEWLGRFQAWWHPEASPATNGAYALSLGCLATAIWLAYFTLLRKKFAAHTLSLAAMLVALAASAALAAFVPGASYLPFWPLAAALAATEALPAAKGAAAYGPAPVLAALVLAVPAVAILVPTAEMVVTALLLTREGGAALVVLIALASTVLVAQTELVTDGRRWWPAGLAVLLGLGAFASGMYSAPHGPSHPRPENVIYALDANASRATWATPIDPPGEWLAQFVGNDPKRGPLASF